MRSISYMAGTLYDDLERNQKDQHINTGFAHLDLCPGMLTVIAGCPGIGCTSLALAIAKNTALAGKRVAYVSLESEATELAQRLVSIISGVELVKLQNKTLDEADWKSLNNAYPMISGMHSLYLSSNAKSMDRIRLECHQIKGLDLLIVDYMQLIRYSQGSRELKALAQEFDMSVIAISQVSREVDFRIDKRPALTDLPCEDIEVDADTIAFLYRDNYYNPNTPYNDIAELLIAKNSKGNTGIVYLKHNKLLATFTDLQNDKHQT